MSFKFIDLFCGLGGFRIAFENNGGECVFSSDIDEHARNTYELNFKEMPYGDITTINANEIPDHDILCAGFPCQPFSTAGKRLGFEDTRGTLFFDIARILDVKRPTALILENVKGIVNHNSGDTLNTILEVLDSIGYDCTYKVINAIEHNIPQNRERWYCIGIRKDTDININEFIFPSTEELKLKLIDVIDKNIDIEKYLVSERCQENIDKFIDKKNIDVKASTLAYDIRPSRCHFVTGEISNCLTAKMGTGGSNVPVIIQQRRKLTEKECLRLMGFPESYKFNIGYQTYKQIGNSVVVPIVDKLAKQIISVCDL
ncbi:MAG: DNA (cytosine-5-)-methyltransferase [Peptostreptococcaceae bacterium]